MLAYCSKCKMMTEKTARRDHANEIVLECVKGHFIKFPADADVQKELAIHNRENYKA